MSVSGTGLLKVQRSVSHETYLQGTPRPVGKVSKHVITTPCDKCCSTIIYKSPQNQRRGQN